MIDDIRLSNLSKMSQRETLKPKTSESSHSGASTISDQYSASGVVDQLHALIQDTPEPMDAVRIEELHTLLEQGRYIPDPDEIAHKIIVMNSLER